MASSANQPSGGVVVVGGISIDLVAITNRHPSLGESILGSDFKIILSGKGANQAVAVRAA